MSIGPISTDWFKQMALFSISKNLLGTNISNNGVDFQAILQAALGSQGGSSIQQLDILNGNIGQTATLPNIQDYSSVLQAKTSLDFTEVSSNRLDSILKGKLANAGELFLDAGRKYNINPTLLASIAIHETGNGTSRAVQEKFNVAGMMTKNGLKQYGSISESIFDMARNLRENYLNKGVDTIPKIGAKYAPVGAANDPTGLNNHWVKGVNNYFHSFV